MPNERMQMMPKQAGRLSILLIVVVFFVGLYWPTFNRLFSLWLTTGFSHGYILGAIFVYGFWKQLSELPEEAQPSLHLFAAAILAFASVFWFFTRVALIDKLELLTFTFLPLVLVWSLFGFQVARRFILPTLILLFSTPIFQLLHNQLQLATAYGADLLLHALGLTFHREGLLIYIPKGAFVVDKGCSGLSALSMGVAIALMYSWVSKLSWLSSLVSVIILAMLAYLSNILRVGIVIYIGYIFSMDHFLVQDHAWVGWITFLIVIVLYFVFAHRFLHPKSEDTESRSAAADEKGTSQGKPSISAFLPVVAVLVLIAAGPILWHLNQARDLEIDGVDYVLADSIDGWRHIASVPTNWQPDYDNAGGKTFKMKNYQGHGRYIYSYVMTFTSQNSENEAINVNNRSYNREKAAKVRLSKIKVSQGSVLGHVVEEQIRIGGEQDLLVWTLYKVGDRIIGSQVLAKVYGVIENILGNPVITVLVFGTEIGGDMSVEEARMSLNEFVAAL